MGVNQLWKTLHDAGLVQHLNVRHITMLPELLPSAPPPPPRQAPAANIAWHRVLRLLRSQGTDNHAAIRAELEDHAVAVDLSLWIMQV